MSKPLLLQLRTQGDPDLRLKAAQALAEWDDINAAPLLIRAAVEDPDARVRAAAHEALLNLIGSETDLALQTYRSAPDDEPWLVAGEELAEEDCVLNSTFEEDQYLSGLITVLRNHADPRMRLKAIMEMGQSSDMRVIAALSETVLWTDEPQVRQAARASLEARFGDETEEIIQSYQVQDYLDQEEEGEEWEDDSEEEGVEELVEENRQPGLATPTQERWQAPSTSPSTAHQVVRDEGFPWLLILIAAVGVVGMVVVIVLLVNR